MGIAVFYFVLSLYILFVFNWKMPLSQLNRERIFTRKSLKTTSDDEGAIRVRNLYLDKEKYIKLRTSFLAMKMGYKPTSGKIDHLINCLKLTLRRRRDYKWKDFVNIDIDILEKMKQQLHEGNLVVDNFPSAREDEYKYDPVFPIWSLLVIALIGCLLEVVFLHLSLTGFFVGDRPAVAIVIVVICAEEVFRRSRNEKERGIAHFAQMFCTGVIIIRYVLVPTLETLNIISIT